MENKVVWIISITNPKRDNYTPLAFDNEEAANRCWSFLNDCCGIDAVLDWCEVIHGFEVEKKE